MGVSDKWPNIHFGMEYPFKYLVVAVVLHETKCT